MEVLSALAGERKTYRKKLTVLDQEIRQVMVGYDRLVRRLLYGLFSDGQKSLGRTTCAHLLLLAYPGLGKSTAGETVAQLIGGVFRRIQLVADMLPADILGAPVLESQNGKKEFTFLRGPIFSNSILLDEINRTPPRTLSAALQAMAEGKVDVGHERFYIEEPFFVIATQNPLEQEGTYPLPEALLDRFAMRITLDYLSEAEEMALSEREDVFADLSLKPVMSREEVVAARAFIRANVYVDRACRAYAVRLVHATRPPTDDPTGSLHRQCLDDLYIGDRSPVLVGCSPRTHLVLVNLAKTRAFLKGRDEVWYEDLQDLAFDVLNHRLVLDGTLLAQRASRPMAFLDDHLIEQGERAFDLRDDIGFLRQVVRRILRGVPTEVAD
jgi:MoxR-like ATPase